MSPFTVHEDGLKKQFNVNIMRPQEPVPEVLPGNFSGTLGGGLPVKQIPHLEFPRIVYKHPTKAFREVEHRNAQHEIVEIERVQAEHLTREVRDEKELEAALADGWVKEQYIPKPLPDRNADLYAKPAKR